MATAPDGMMMMTAMIPAGKPNWDHFYESVWDNTYITD
jgi:hypothetical protein